MSRKAFLQQRRNAFAAVLLASLVLAFGSPALAPAHPVQFLDKWGSLGVGAGQFNFPVGIDVDSDSTSTSPT